MMAGKQPPKTENPPGVINSIAAGFELTTSHLWLVSLPVFLDVFLWLGPRLGIERLLRELLATLPPDEALDLYIQQLLALAPQANLLSSLSFPFLGVPALMAGPSAMQTPLPTTLVELSSLSGAFWSSFGLNLVGLVLGALYFTALVQTLGDESLSPAGWLRRVGRGAWRLVGLVAVGLALIFFLTLAMLPIMLLVAVLGIGVTAVAFLGAVLGMWLAFYLSFSLHGIMFHQAGVVPAVLGSIRLVQRHMWPTLLLLVTVVIVNNGLNSLWRLVDNGSWLTLVSILGHGFISTALLLSTFLFYRARTESARSERDAKLRIRII